MKLLSKIGLISASIAMVALPSVAVAAQGSDATTESSTSTSAKTEPVATRTEVSDATTTKTDTSAETETNNPTRSNNEDKIAAAQAKKAEAKLKVCENHQRVVTNIMTRISDRGQKQLDLFTTIADRAEAFYTAKGKTLSNYQTLVDDVNAQKAAAQTAVTTVATDATSFKCDGTNDTVKVTSFKSSLKAEISALKDYKTAVKNLIVGIKSVQSTTADAKTSTSTTTGGNQ